MIVITGAAGFIASALLGYLNDKIPGADIIIVDKFSERSKDRNYKDKKFISCVDRNVFHGYFDEHHEKIDFVFHLGARTDTSEQDISLFDHLNLNYSKKIWKNCVMYNIPLVYASSAATYGDGSLGFEDSHSIVNDLKPLNPYGNSKNDFDKWVLTQEDHPPFWAGLKFFNVYGPNEYHKGRMASVVFHAFNQIRTTKKMELFRSHKEGIADGEQARDFIYVKDIIKICHYLFENHNKISPGIYNLGSGTASSFNSLAKAVFNALGLQENISYIDTPEDIRDKYQYYTCADIEKLKKAGYKQSFYSLEEGIDDYVKNYLFEKTYL